MDETATVGLKGIFMQLVMVDTTGIQPYIFGSNRLRENIGASYSGCAGNP
jgi:hypothetical protein